MQLGSESLCKNLYEKFFNYYFLGQFKNIECFINIRVPVIKTVMSNHTRQRVKDTKGYFKIIRRKYTQNIRHKDFNIITDISI